MNSDRLPKTDAAQPRNSEDDKTVLLDQSAPVELTHQDEGVPTKPVHQRPANRLSWPGRDSASKPPAPAERETLPPHLGSSSSSDKATRMFYAQTRTESPAHTDAQFDPVVGWLVVTAGPGKGSSIEIRAGANSIGRQADQQICVDFGDEAISRSKHASIVFDSKSNRFYIQAGDSRSLTYLGDDLVLTPRELKNGDTIAIGNTSLRLCAFCGEDFSW